MHRAVSCATGRRRSSTSSRIRTEVVAKARAPAGSEVRGAQCPARWARRTPAGALWLRRSVFRSGRLAQAPAGDGRAAARSSVLVSTGAQGLGAGPESAIVVTRHGAGEGTTSPGEPAGRIGASDTAARFSLITAGPAAHTRSTPGGPAARVSRPTGGSYPGTRWRTGRNSHISTPPFAKRIAPTTFPSATASHLRARQYRRSSDLSPAARSRRRVSRPVATRRVAGCARGRGCRNRLLV